MSGDWFYININPQSFSKHELTAVQRDVGGTAKRTFGEKEIWSKTSLSINHPIVHLQIMVRETKTLVGKAILFHSNSEGTGPPLNQSFVTTLQGYEIWQGQIWKDFPLSEHELFPTLFLVILAYKPWLSVYVDVHVTMGHSVMWDRAQMSVKSDNEAL